MIGIILLLVGALAAGPGPGTATIVAAHRGVTGPGQAQNSLASLRTARIAADAAEIDLRATADGAIVLLHDAEVGGRPAARLSLEQLRRAQPDIATFEEALDATRDGPSLLIDLKRPGGIDPARIVALAREHEALDRIMIGARSPADVRAYRMLSPSIRIVAFIRTERDVAAFEAAGADSIRLWPRWILAPESGCAAGPSSACLVQRLQARGLSVWTTADAPDDPVLAGACLTHLLALRPDGVLTDRADLARPLTRVSSARAPMQFPGLRRCTW